MWILNIIVVLSVKCTLGVVPNSPPYIYLSLCGKLSFLAIAFSVSMNVRKCNKILII